MTADRGYYVRYYLQLEVVVWTVIREKWQSLCVVRSVIPTALSAAGSGGGAEVVTISRLLFPGRRGSLYRKKINADKQGEKLGDLLL